MPNIRVAVRTQYPPELGDPGDVVEFELSPMYGFGSAAQAHAWILEQLDRENYVEPLDAEGGEPCPFHRETVSEIVIRQEPARKADPQIRAR